MSAYEEVSVRTPLAVGSLVRAHPWPSLVWFAVVSWSALLAFEVRSDYLGFRVGRFDLGNMVQAVWSTAHGRPLEVTLGDGEQAARLASHVDPILALFAPMWLVWPSPLLLAVVQVVACALGALPVFWLGRRHLASEMTAALLAVAYLFYPWVVWTALDAMHPVTLAIPLLLYSIWFLDTDRVWAFALCAVLAASTGELMGLTVAALGLWYWLARGHRRKGLLIAGSGFIWTLIAVKVIVPAFRGGDSPFYGYYASVGGSPEGVIRTVFTDPGRIAAALFSGNDVAYVFLLGLPVAGLFLFAPGLSAAAVPQLIANCLSDSPAPTGPQQHYVAAVIPFLIAATVLGISRLGRTRQVFWASVVVTGSAAMTLFVGPLPGAPIPVDIWYQKHVPQRHVDALEAAVALIPGGARVSATNKAGAHLSARRYVYTVPSVERANWIVLDMRDPWVIADAESLTLGERRDVLRAFRQRIERSPEWAAVFEQDEVLVARRTASR